MYETWYVHGHTPAPPCCADRSRMPEPGRRVRLDGALVLPSTQGSGFEEEAETLRFRCANTAVRRGKRDGMTHQTALR